MTDQIVPEQVDRDAAAELLGYRDWDDATDYRLSGGQDRQVEKAVQAFARHRIAAFNAGMERAAGIADKHGDKLAGYIIATAIRAAKEPTP